MKKRIKRYLFAIYKRLFSFLGRILPKKDNLIIFESFLGKQYSDNPRALYEYLKLNYPEYKMYWSSERKSIQKFQQLNLPYARRFSIKWMFKMNRAKYWVTNSRLPLWIPKPEKTIYLQTWHGTPLKKLAADMDEVHMPGTNTNKYKKNFIKETKKWDYLVSPNNYSTQIFKRAFQFEKNILETGYPRNDFLINENNPDAIDKIKSKIGIPTNKKVILYAPTWRDNQFYGRSRYKFVIQMDLDLLREELNDEYVILLRMHYLIAENLDLSNYDGFIFDMSHHEDIRELYLISDMLITDYSSVFFDYAILKRPMIFYVYDIEEYRDNLRGFYFDFENEAPGPLVKTTEELIKEIQELNDGLSQDKNFETFYQRFCCLEDGHASERIVQQIFLKDTQN